MSIIKVKDKQLQTQLDNYFSTIEDSGLIVKYVEYKKRKIGSKLRTIHLVKIDDISLYVHIQGGKELVTIKLKNKNMTTPIESNNFDAKSEAEELVKYIKFLELKNIKKTNNAIAKKVEKTEQNKTALQQELEQLQKENETLKKELKELKGNNDE